MAIFFVKFTNIIKSFADWLFSKQISCFTTNNYRPFLSCNYVMERGGIIFKMLLHNMNFVIDNKISKTGSFPLHVSYSLVLQYYLLFRIINVSRIYISVLETRVIVST